MRLRKKLLVVALMVALAASFAAYAWSAKNGRVGAEENQEQPSEVTKFKAVVNGMTSVDVLVHIDISDGLTEKEAKLIAEATFIQIMGENVTHRLDTLTFDDTQIKAHYTWGHDKTDMGHVFYLIADLTTLQITVSHCF